MRFFGLWTRRQVSAPENVCGLDSDAVLINRQSAPIQAQVLRDIGMDMLAARFQRDCLTLGYSNLALPRPGKRPDPFPSSIALLMF